MQTLNDISIKKKLVLVIMLVVMTAMSVACTAFVVNDVQLIKQDMAQQLTALAQVLGTTSTAALERGDRATVEKLLDSLHIYSALRTAIVCDAKGAVFASYSSGDVPIEAPVIARESGYQFRHGHLEVVKTLDVGGHRLGTIFLEGDLNFIWLQMLQYAVIVVVVLLVSCGAGYLLAAKLQRIISGPILDLTHTVQDISRKNDYGIRVNKSGGDELGTLCDEFNRMLDQIESTKQALQQSHDELEIRVQDRTRELSETNQELSKEIVERVRAERELEAVHREFVDAARRAGMAEIATGVLHNVGNVLNSVNVSATMLTNQLRASKLNQLVQVVSLLDQHQANLAEFIANDEKGRQVPRFLKVLSEHLAKEDQSLAAEAESLVANVEYIKAIIATQQSYAKSERLAEATDVNAILDDALRLNSESFDRHGIHVERDFADLAPLFVDKQRVMQIVTNLIKNAKESLIEHEGGRRVLRLSTRTEDDRLVLEVTDTGLGIEPESLTRIFAHGFTTKSTGHGFGLHSCANAATEMEGSLSAASAGPMQGATFTLKLPLRPVPVMA